MCYGDIEVYALIIYTVPGLVVDKIGINAIT